MTFLWMISPQQTFVDCLVNCSTLATSDGISIFQESDIRSGNVTSVATYTPRTELDFGTLVRYLNNCFWNFTQSLFPRSAMGSTQLEWEAPASTTSFQPALQSHRSTVTQEMSHIALSRYRNQPAETWNHFWKDVLPCFWKSGQHLHRVSKFTNIQRACFTNFKSNQSNLVL